MTSDKPSRVLYVSDSLGTPIHPRGIFNYSVSAVEILKSLGFEVTLVVEGSPGYGLPRGQHGRSRNRLEREIADVIMLAEIYRYFDESHFGFDFEYRSPLARLLADRAPGLLKLAIRAAEWRGTGAGFTIANVNSRLDWVPSSATHLRLVDRLRVQPRFYSQSMLRAVNGTGPVEIDASGYDLVFVDTPHYARVHGVAASRVIAVVHDLIPIQDSHMGADWRRLFTRKLEATLDMAGTLVFVSETTRHVFNDLFPQHAAIPSLILYPAIREDLLSKADASPAEDDGFIADFGPVRRARHVAALAKVLPESLPVALALEQIDISDVRAFFDAGPAWNPVLPYFATVLSDEPRKNIKIFVAAAEALRDKANLVVIGQVDPGRHTGGFPERYPNLHFTGYVNDADKLALIRNSAGLVFASFSEGFGIPVVEGAVFGRPVICSDIPVFREITGDFATFIDPDSPEALVRAILADLADPAAALERAQSLRALCTRRYNQSAMAGRLGDALATLAVDRAA